MFDFTPVLEGRSYTVYCNGELVCRGFRTLRSAQRYIKELLQDYAETQERRAGWYV